MGLRSWLVIRKNIERNIFRASLEQMENRWRNRRRYLSLALKRLRLLNWHDEQPRRQLERCANKLFRPSATRPIEPNESRPRPWTRKLIPIKIQYFPISLRLNSIIKHSPRARWLQHGGAESPARNFGGANRLKCRKQLRCWSASKRPLRGNPEFQ